MSKAVNNPAKLVTNLVELDPSHTSSPAEAANDNVELKARTIVQACQKKDIDLLVQLATTRGGLLNDDLRRIAWPILIGSEWLSEEEKDIILSASWKDLPPHQDEAQVLLDVNRAFVYYPSGESENKIDGRKSSLFNLIVQVLREHPMLCYFQGYHDIVQVLLLVLGERLAPPAVSRISLLRIRDYMLPSLAPSLRHLQIIPCLLELVDPELGRRLSQTRPFFALAATLTLYAHDIQEYSDIARLFDFILAHEPIVAIYMFTAIVLSRREELLAIPIEEPEMLHFTLSKLPQPLDLESLISETINLFEKYPPRSLPRLTWWNISSYSVLKTSRNFQGEQSLRMGEELLAKQAAQLRREEIQKKALRTLHKYQRPGTSVVLALLAGCMSVWLIRNGHDRTLWGYIARVKGAFHIRR